MTQGRNSLNCKNLLNHNEPLYLLPVVFRLNEGHTVYLERMIGRCMEGEQFRQFKAMGGWKDLQDSVRPRTYTCLVKSSTLI